MDIFVIIYWVINILNSFDVKVEQNIFWLCKIYILDHSI